MDSKIKNEVKALIKIGLPENIAIITACANNGKSELAHEYLEELSFEQSEIIDMVKYLVPFGSEPVLENIESNIIIDDTKEETKDETKDETKEETKDETKKEAKEE